jgi:hypothetical protein
MMRVIFCVLCVATWSGVAGAQHVSNFDACVSEATQKHADSTMDNYSSYRCDGATAQKLAVRPDECSSDVKPGRIERKSKQLGNGLYLRTVWRTRTCAGMCEIRFYDDSKDPSYRCEVRRHNGETREAQNDDPPARRYRRYPYPYYYPTPQRTWRPVRRYDDAPGYDRRQRLDEEDARRMDRWIYRGEWYRVYPREDRDQYRDVHRDDRDDYRRD